MEEGFSLDTLGNAYFLRSTHIDPGRFTRMVVVTNDWHMGRARAFFEAVFSLAYQGPDSIEISLCLINKWKPHFHLESLPFDFELFSA